LKLKNHNLSLKGISGIFTGVLSLLFIWIIQLLLLDFSSGSQGIGILPISIFEIILGVISLVYILQTYFMVAIINKRRRKKNQLFGWEKNSKKIRMLFLFLLILGGIITYFLIFKGFIKLILPSSLLLYGLGCVFSNRYTNENSLLLGILFMVNGVFAIIFPKQTILLWGMAFGGYHIIYGFIYFLKSKS